jgi:FG-GAP-like repeat
MRRSTAGVVAALALLLSTDADARLRFEPEVIGRVDGFASDIAIARLDRDRRPDVAVAVERGVVEPGGVQLVLNRAWSYRVNPLVAGGTTPYRIAVGDLDGDGDADAAVPNTASQDVTVFGNDGAANLVATATLPAPYLTRGIAIAELDGDRRADVVTSANGDPDGLTPASLRLFSAAALPPLTVPAADFLVPLETILAIDADQDWRRDLVAVDQSGVVVSHRTAAGFEPARRVALVEDGPFDVAAADLDRDGRLDLATANIIGPRVAVLLRAPDNTGYEAPRYLDVGAPSAQIAIADFDGDRRRDLAVSLLDAGQVAVMRGTRHGFRAPRCYAAGPVPLALEAADMDLDGDTDLVVGDRDSQEIRVLVNQRR